MFSVHTAANWPPYHLQHFLVKRNKDIKADAAIGIHAWIYYLRGIKTLRQMLP